METLGIFNILSVRENFVSKVHFKCTLDTRHFKYIYTAFYFISFSQQLNRRYCYRHFTGKETGVESLNCLLRETAQTQSQTHFNFLCSTILLSLLVHGQTLVFNFSFIGTCFPERERLEQCLS